MQFRWEAKDIRGGRFLKTKALTDAMIGWHTVQDSDKGSTMWGIIDCRDGMFLHVSFDKDEMAKHLNDYGYVPLTLE